MTAAQARLVMALRRLTDLPVRDCETFLAENAWDIERVIALMRSYRWLSGLSPQVWEQFRQDLRDCGYTNVKLPPEAG